MLILGITTSTAQVGLRHRRPRGRPRRDPLARGAGATPRPSRRPSSSSAGRPAWSSATSAPSPSTSGPGMFTGLRVGVAAGKALAHARRLPMIGVTSLDLLAFPLRHSHRRIVCAIDAGRGEIFHASYRQSPGGVQRITEPEVGIARRPRLRAAGHRRGGAARRATARCATATRSTASGGVELADRGEAYPLGRRRSCSWRTPGRCARSSCSPAELTPLYLRKPDAEINWTTRTERRADGRSRGPADPDDLEVTIGADAPPPPARRCCASSSRCTRGRGRWACS